ncbi:MAG: sulfatase-like hydrolase/transferase [Planctomycetales bacterium]|nr:sulfatase-like hydrolase/transferase [Planctomycetales bacterium]
MPCCRFPLLLVGGILSACLAIVSPAQAADRPNILFFMADDHGYQAMSCYGSQVNETPNIDRIARDGMRFDRAFVTNSICGPCRAVILTGKYSHLNGFARNGDRFDGSQQTVAKLLQSVGYETAVIGKWHLETDPTGFDHWQILQGQGPYYNPVMLTADGRVPMEGYTTDIITDLTLDWLENRDDSKPFFLLCWHKAPHRNWEPGPNQLDMYRDGDLPEPATLFDNYEGRGTAAHEQEMTVANHLSRHDLKLDPPRDTNAEQRVAWDAAYAEENAAYEEADLSGDALTRWNYQRYVKDYLRCVAGVDAGVGRVLDYLDDSGLAENTIVIYSSDQGWYLGEHGWYDKRWMYEESFRTPLLVRWPEHVKPGSVNTDLCLNLDLAETFLDIAGAEIPGDMQGRSLKSVLEGATPDDWRQEIYYRYYEFPGPHMVAKHFGIRTPTHKLMYFHELDEWEMYDLEKDPHELQSVADDPEYESLRRDLEQRLKALQEQYDDDGSVANRRAAIQRALPPATPVRVARQAVTVGKEAVAHFDSNNANDPSFRPLIVGGWVKWQGEDGVLVAQGGESHGYSLAVFDGVPTLSVRSHGTLTQLQAAALPRDQWVHLVASMNEGQGAIMVDGEPAAVGDDLSELQVRPADGIDIGVDNGSLVGPSAAGAFWSGELRDVRVVLGGMSEQEFGDWLQDR